MKLSLVACSTVEVPIRMHYTQYDQSQQNHPNLWNESSKTREIATSDALECELIKMHGHLRTNEKNDHNALFSHTCHDSAVARSP